MEPRECKFYSVNSVKVLMRNGIYTKKKKKMQQQHYSLSSYLKIVTAPGCCWAWSTLLSTIPAVTVQTPPQRDVSAFFFRLRAQFPAVLKCLKPSSPLCNIWRRLLVKWSARRYLSARCCPLHVPQGGLDAVNPGILSAINSPLASSTFPSSFKQTIVQSIFPEIRPWSGNPL